MSFTPYKTSNGDKIEERHSPVKTKEGFEPDHLVQEGYDPVYTRNMPDLTYLHDKLQAKVLHSTNGELIYAYCYGHIPMCYATSTEFPWKGVETPNTNQVPFLSKDNPKSRDVELDMYKIRKQFPRLFRIHPAAELLRDVWPCFTSIDFIAIAQEASRQSTDQSVIQFLSNKRSQCEAAKEEKNVDLQTYFADEIRDNKSKFKAYMEAFRNDLELAFNFLLVSNGLRKGLIFNKLRYCLRPWVFKAILSEAHKSTAIQTSISKDGMMVLIYNSRQNGAFTEDLIMAAFKHPSGAIFGQLNDYLCPSTVKGGSCLIFLVNNVVFYFETCVSYPDRRKLEDRVLTWQQLGKEVGVDVRMEEVSLMLADGFQNAIYKCDANRLFQHRCSVSRRFWGDDFWSITGHMFIHAASTLKDMQKLCAGYWCVWQLILMIQESKILSSAKNSSLSIQDTRTLRRLIGELECKMYHALAKPYSLDRLRSYATVLERVGFVKLAEFGSGPNVLTLQDERVALISMLADLAITLDKYRTFFGEPTSSAQHLEASFIHKFSLSQLLYRN